MLPDTVFCRTRHGALALVDPLFPLSPGFRRMLKLINGVRPLRELISEMPQLDERDIAMWLDELMRKDLVAIDGMVETSELAFQMTSDMAQVMRAVAPPDADVQDPGNLIDDIVIDVALAIDPAPNSAIEKRLESTGRMAAIESVSSFGAVGRSGFFVYPDAAEGLPDKLRVCVASHEKAQNTMLQKALARSGVTLTVCADRHTLKPVLRGDALPHVLLVDGEMPRLNGFRLLEMISAKPEYKGMHVVLISERGGRADLARALMLGAAGYIVKPLRREVLEIALPQIIGRPLH